jgi:hypothetical protein
MADDKHAHNIIYKTVESIDQTGDTVWKDAESLLVTHQHENGDQPHHHHPEELSGGSQDVPPAGDSEKKSASITFWE